MIFQNDVGLHVNSENRFLGVRCFYDLKFLFDSKYISGFRMVKGIFKKYFLSNKFLSWTKIEKTSNLQMQLNFYKKIVCSFCNINWKISSKND